MVQREPPTAARIAEIRRRHEEDGLDFAAFASEAGTTIAEQEPLFQRDRADLLAALDYCRDVMVSAAIAAPSDARSATDTIVDCLYRLFPEDAQ